MIHKFILFLGLFLSLQISHAGGTYFPIKIDNIQTISKKEHIIKFKILENDFITKDTHQLANCDSVILNIQYQEWEWDEKIVFLLSNIFTFNNNIKKLNKNIDNLKNNPTQRFLLSDMGSFQYHPNNDCELFSKTLEIENSYHGNFVKNQPDETLYLLQPERHRSRIESKFKK